MYSAMGLVPRARGGVGLIFSAFVNHFSTASNSDRLAGKVAVITGAASGIGKATATEFIRNGAKVILADIQDDLGRAVAAELGPDAAFTRCDVTDEAQIAAAVDFAVARHGRLDVLYSNAGITGSLAPTPLESFDLANFDHVMAVNARAAVVGVKHAARVMVPRRSGCILCTSSIAGVVGDSAPPAYSISKTTIIGVVRAVAAQLARDGVRVNAISPHGILTPLGMRAMVDMFPGASGEELKRMTEEDMNEMEGVVLEAEDIARAAVYLASDEAKYVTGHNLVVDGGFTVGKRLNIPSRWGSASTFRRVEELAKWFAKFLFLRTIDSETIELAFSKGISISIDQPRVELYWDSKSERRIVYHHPINHCRAISSYSRNTPCPCDALTR